MRPIPSCTSVIRHLPVLQDGCLVGIVSDRDIRLVLPSPATSLAVWEIRHLLARLTVGDMMTCFVMTTAPDCLLTEAVGRLWGTGSGRCRWLQTDAW